MSQPIHILELRSVRGTGGGPEKTILLGAAGADPDRFRVTVCYIRDERDDVFAVSSRAEDLGVDYVEIRERHSFDPSVWPALRQIVAQRRIDIVHAHEYKSDLLAWMLAKASRVIPLATVHGWTGHSARERHVYYPCDKRVLARYPALIAVSEEIRGELVRHGAGPDRVTTVLNGIDETKFRRRGLRQEARAQLGFRATDIVVGAVGRLEPQKRFDILLRAVSILRKTWPVRVVIAGDGSELASLQRLIRELQMESYCVLAGHCPDVIPFHDALDLLVQSSDYEGTPNAVLEAMALETPIVATDVGGTGEMARAGVDALLVPPRDPLALATAMQEVLERPVEAACRVRAARQRIEHVLSFTARMRKVENIYEQLMQRPMLPRALAARSL